MVPLLFLRLLGTKMGAVDGQLYLYPNQAKRLELTTEKQKKKRANALVSRCHSTSVHITTA